MSRDPRGSSINNNSGDAATARASATRCRSPAGQIFGAPVQETVKVQQVHQAIGVDIAGFRGSLVIAVHHVFSDAHVREQKSVLEYIAHPSAFGSKAEAGNGREEGLAPQCDFAIVRVDESGYCVEYGGLAAAGRPEK